mmetsp:Transcript_19307/g.49586  ORF Transcript_19307/g.49586 Transcript_19307/m.49586 type:complete len:281 (+) Transcript_19307:3408-4250(+)
MLCQQRQGIRMPLEACSCEQGVQPIKETLLQLLFGFFCRDVTVRLLPSRHVRGSCQLLQEIPADSANVLQCRDKAGDILHVVFSHVLEKPQYVLLVSMLLPDAVLETISDLTGGPCLHILHFRLHGFQHTLHQRLSRRRYRNHVLPLVIFLQLHQGLGERCFATGELQRPVAIQDTTERTLVCADNLPQSNEVFNVLTGEGSLVLQWPKRLHAGGERIICVSIIQLEQGRQQSSDLASGGHTERLRLGVHVWLVICCHSLQSSLETLHGSLRLALEESCL